MQALNRTCLSLPTGITGPSYDVRQVTPGIVHIGLGNFHRAHFARYTHDLMEIEPLALKWGIVGAGLRTNDAALLAALREQDGLYTLVERDQAGESRTVIGSVIGAIDACAGTEALLEAMARTETRIVSVTVSEHGYNLDSATKTFSSSSEAVQHDVAFPQAPRTMPGVIVEALRRRRERGVGGFTALSCDNIQNNGDVFAASVLQLADLTDPALATWIAGNVCFPNSMVDRITPSPTSGEIAAFVSQTGLADRAPVFAETFRQWVVEDRFSAGRPEWERVGAQFVPDVAAYEAMKLRLLNGSHLAIASLASLIGFETIPETMKDPLIRRYMMRLMDTETGPIVPPVPGVDLNEYKSELLDRFANPAIQDTVNRINRDAPLNLLLDPIRVRLQEDASIDLLALGLAAWCIRVKAEADIMANTAAILSPSGIPYVELHRLGGDALTLLSFEPIFGSVGRDPRLISNVGVWVRRIKQQGVATSLASIYEREFL